MAFSYNGSNLPSLPNYRAAFDFWSTANTWRGRTDEYDERKLDGKKQFVVIRKYRDDSIRCRLHNTDVVMYYPDRIVLTAWASVSTDTFANGLLRGTNIGAAFNQGVVSLRLVDGTYRYYKAASGMTFAPDERGRYALQSEPEPFVRYLINRQRAKDLLDSTNYKDFAAWVKMVEAQQIEIERIWAGAYTTGWLDDRKDWPKLISNLTAKECIGKLRSQLYRDNKHVYDTFTELYYTDWKEVENWKKTRYR